jgi:hypothetical protein
LVISAEAGGRLAVELTMSERGQHRRIESVDSATIAGAE